MGTHIEIKELRRSFHLASLSRSAQKQRPWWRVSRMSGVANQGACFSHPIVMVPMYARWLDDDAVFLGAFVPVREQGI